MFKRLLGFALVGLIVCGLSQDAIGQKDKKKFEVPKDAITGTVKNVDLKANSFTITLADKKDRTFKVDDKTEFWGPKGGDRGTGAKGLMDDCMEKGYEIRVVALAKDAKTAKDVFLPNRKSDEKKDKK